MEKKEMLQYLVPGLVAAGVVMVIGLLVANSDWKDQSLPKKDGADLPAFTGSKGSGKVEDEAVNDKGMTETLPETTGEGWKELGDGLRYKDVVMGDGPDCYPGAQVKIHYTGWRLDGVIFDSSRGKAPATFALSGLIKGWQLGIPGMKPGGIRYLSIPAPLAYGAQGNPPKIPANATLVFEVKLLAFN
jgi:FKBP-type peptidyl-prolyl cis-trans isomerase